jgi:hypothetical protein
LTDPHRFYRFKENIEITDDYSFRLYHALKNRFPALDFTLIVMNYRDDNTYLIERELNDNLFVVGIPLRVNTDAILTEKCKDFFYKLMAERTFLPHAALDLY